MKNQIIFALALVMTIVACDHKKKNKDGSKAASNQPKAEKAAVDAECQQGIEGRWDLDKSADSQSRPLWDLSKYIQPQSESFSIVRGENGILRMRKMNLVDAIEFDGISRLIRFQDSRQQWTSEGATYSAKCVGGVIFVSEKKVVADMGETGEVALTYEYRLSGEEGIGRLYVWKGTQIVAEYPAQKDLTTGPSTKPLTH